jgi:hypothetical protein
MIHPLARVALAGMLLALPACQSTYYSAMEKFGVHKRDILVDRVQEGRDAQEEAKEQFQTALEAFKSVESFDGGDLEKVHDKLNREYERSEARVQAVRNRIESIEDVSKDLFKEWENELDEYENEDFRRKSEQQMLDTKERYEELITAMRRAESKMQPVLTAFGDQVLFLKHNLNAKAISSLQGSLVEIEADVGALIGEMEASIAEADAFIASMKGTPES